jgi:hypothetical protein
MSRFDRMVLRPLSMKHKFAKLLFWLLLPASLLAEDNRSTTLNPQLVVASVQRGSTVNRETVVRTIGSSTFAQYSEATKRVAAVKVQLRSFSVPAEPYEVQCFFVAKGPDRQRYVYDAVKTTSKLQYDEINIFSRDLFGGSVSFQKTTSGGSYFGVDANGLQQEGALTTSQSELATKPGSKIEGWIVRVLSGGKVIRTEASLHELKEFASKSGAELDGIASRSEMSH